MFVQAILLTCLLGFWQANPGKEDVAYDTGRVIGQAIGFCLCPLALIVIVYALYKLVKGKKAQK